MFDLRNPAGHNCVSSTQWPHYCVSWTQFSVEGIWKISMMENKKYKEKTLKNEKNEKCLKNPRHNYVSWHNFTK